MRKKAKKKFMKISFDKLSKDFLHAELKFKDVHIFLGENFHFIYFLHSVQNIEIMSNNISRDAKLP